MESPSTSHRKIGASDLPIELPTGGTMSAHSECRVSTDPSPVCVPPPVLREISKLVLKDDVSADVSKDEKTLEQVKSATGCDSESCVIRKVYDKNKATAILNKYFKPAGPREAPALFDNFNIDNVLQQFAEKYKGFLHIEYQMIDFMDTETQLAKTRLSDVVDSGYKCIGCVFNTDVHTGRGKHWFAIFCDFRTLGTVSSPYTIEYFNSSGRPPMEPIHIWARLAINELESKKKCTCEFVIVSRIQQQHDTHSCGPYAIYYIWSRLEGIPYTDFRQHIITDEQMVQFRRHLFRKVS